MRYSDHEQRQMDTKSGEELDRRERQRKAKEARQSGSPICELCGKLMPRGEEMFRYHGYSGPCPVDDDLGRPVPPHGSGP